MALDAGVLNLAAGLLALVAVTRVASANVPVNLAPFAGDALLGLALAGTALLALGFSLELAVLYVGAAILAGLYWTGVARHRPKLSGAGLALSALGAAFAVLLVLGAARLYQWWFAPLGLLLAMAGGVAAQGIGWLLGRPQPVAAAAAPAPAAPAAAKPAPPVASAAAPATAPPLAPAQKVSITCPSCGLIGQVAAQGSPTLKCPRCSALVPRRATASPPPGGAPGPRTPPPPRRGPSS
ncbi:MAG: hypothetical protein QOG31_529 [Thermoplasmata archaeon]|jgi:hypothetical protein|nr:hypothetical protein [Thermoplasmata archaeon]